MTDLTATDADSRSSLRRAIVDAAAELLREGGLGAVTTRAVSQTAGVQPPTIYRLFGDKDGLVDAVAEQVMATYVASKDVDASSDPVGDLRAGWHRHVEFGLANPHVYAILNDPLRGGASAASIAGMRVLRERVRRVAAAGRLRVDEQRGVEMIHAAGAGTVLALLEQPPGTRDTGLADAMFEAVSSRILVDPRPEGPVPGDDQTALLVTFATVVPNLSALSDGERALLSEWIARAIRAKGD